MAEKIVIILMLIFKNRLVSGGWWERAGKGKYTVDENTHTTQVFKICDSPKRWW